MTTVIDRDSTATITAPGIVDDVIHVGTGDRVVHFHPLSDDLFEEQHLTVFAVASPRQIICWASDSAPTLVRVAAADVAGVIDRRTHPEAPRTT